MIVVNNSDKILIGSNHDQNWDENPNFNKNLKKSQAKEELIRLSILPQIIQQTNVNLSGNDQLRTDSAKPVLQESSESASPKST